MQLSFETLTRFALRSGINYRYHYNHITQAKRILKRIEGGKGSLSQSVVKQCDEYAVDILGHRHFAPWLYVYSVIAGRFKEGWIPDNYYGSAVIPKLKGDYGIVSALKPLHSAIFSHSCFPDLLSYSNGLYFDTECRVLPADSIKDRLFADQGRVVFKLNNSSRGRGIFFFDRESFDPSKIHKLGNGLFQRFIRQHREFQEFAKDSVATLRMTTVLLDDGTASLRASYLRLGIGTDTHVQSESHVRIPIDINSGTFSDIGFTPDWVEIEYHPTSKMRFRGKVIPAYDACHRLVTTLHRRVPYARCIGWDLAVDEQENVSVMEWNAQHNDIKFSEATQGPCFSDLHWEQLKD